uniref:Uncharacterized protein n=1 Tax=Equus caballus TaxID=9796 RepID=A0A9L0SUL7_HORSE
MGEQAPPIPFLPQRGSLNTKRNPSNIPGDFKQKDIETETQLTVYSQYGRGNASHNVMPTPPHHPPLLRSHSRPVWLLSPPMCPQSPRSAGPTSHGPEWDVSK